MIFECAHPHALGEVPIIQGEGGAEKGRKEAREAQRGSQPGGAKQEPDAQHEEEENIRKKHGMLKLHNLSYGALTPQFLPGAHWGIGHNYQ